MNPLLNEKLNSWTCYFSDYISWIFYYPVMIYYFFCLILSLVVIGLLSLGVIFFGFLIGTLFGLLGERDNNVKNMFQKGMQHMYSGVDLMKEKLGRGQVKNP